MRSCAHAILFVTMRYTVKGLWVLLIAVVAASAARAETVFSNLNTNPSAVIGSGFTAYAQRFTTVSSGTGLQVDVNVVSLSGTQAYNVELWSANGAGTNIETLLATIGSASTSSSDRTAVTSYSLAYSLSAATNYFICLTGSGNLGVVVGPSDSSTLNSVLRYGTTIPPNNQTTSALGMRVDVVGVPEPSALALAGMALCGLAAWRGRARSA